MGNDLLVTYKGKIIADLGRKHNYSCGGIFVPKSYDELEEELKTVRKQVIADVMTRVGILSTLDKESYEEIIIGLVAEITDSLDWLEEECITAGRVMTLIELGDDFNKDIEIIDEYELEQKEREEEAAWKRLDEYLAACEEDGIYDAVEHQMSDVDLDWECDDPKNHMESIEEIGYCSECRIIEQENDEYLDRQNRQ